MVDLNNIRVVYFIGIGGIGMSALARYFHSQGKVVSGYDKTGVRSHKRIGCRWYCGPL
jgi:UDP-N-acetylmuramate--alanine ligase